VTAGENGGDEVLDDFLVADDLATDLRALRATASFWSSSRSRSSVVRDGLA
jgi:hypothetical protein